MMTGHGRSPCKDASVSAAREAGRTVAAGCRVHPAQFGTGRRGPSSGGCGTGSLAAGDGWGGWDLRPVVARHADVPAADAAQAPAPLARGRGDRRGPTRTAPGPVRTASRVRRACRSPRPGPADRTGRRTPRYVDDGGCPWRRHLRDGPAHAPGGSGAQPAPGDGGPVDPAGRRGRRRGLRRPPPAVAGALAADRPRAARRSGRTAGGRDNALPLGGAPGASGRVRRRRSPDPLVPRGCSSS